MRTNQPSDATHISDLGIYYKQVGQFWYVFHDGSWFAVSGTPAYSLTKIDHEAK